MKYKSIQLSQEVDVLSGYAWKSSNFKKEPRGLPIIRIQNVGNGDFNSFVYWDEPYDDRFIIYKGEILLTLSGSFRVTEWSGPVGLLNQRILKLTPSSSYDKSFFIHYLDTQLKIIENMGRHALVNNVSVTDIKKLTIPLPPLEEQKRIARILDTADEIRAKRRQSIEELDRLAQSIFLDMFGDPVTNPKGWEVSKITDVVSGKYGIKAGPFGSSLKKEDYVENGYRVYGQEQVIAGSFDVGDYYIDEIKYQKLKNCAVKAGDILMSLVGSFGKVLIVPDGIEKGIINPRIVKITPDLGQIDSTFLATILENEATQKTLKNMAHGGTMGIINASIIKQLSVILPPISLQKKFTNIVHSIEVQKNIHQQHLRELNNLFACLQSRAFGGSL